MAMPWLQVVPREPQGTADNRKGMGTRPQQNCTSLVQMTADTATHWLKAVSAVIWTRELVLHRVPDSVPLRSSAVPSRWCTGFRSKDLPGAWVDQRTRVPTLEDHGSILRERGTVEVAVVGRGRFLAEEE
jgi:hypothetical protein